ncbi:MAG: UDP-N-acetylmuramate dehydrogenase, partial [Acidimicrobiaceae bacterium]|nr:UDP-N-acetylmuramate dehydrogenase [Acidimicrobiaceae bacterium]
MNAALDEAAALLGERARRDVPIGPMTTYRVGGPAALFLEATGEDDLLLARGAVSSTGIPVLVVGRGSNLLISDAGFPGLALTLGPSFTGIDILSECRARAGAAVQLPVLARRTAALGLTGLEWAVGVPGSVGGAIRMNAGGHGADTAASLRRFRFVDLTGMEPDGEADARRLAFGYRHSSVAPHHVVVWGEFGLSPGDAVASQATIADIVRWRRDHQPGGQNAGSVFTNPPGDSAGRLVEAAGLKGLRWGTAQVSTKHANFIQAGEGGSADDVRALMMEVQRRVKEQLGVELHTEVRLIGFAE